MTAWIKSSTVAGAPSARATQVSPGKLRTAITTSPRIAMPKTLNSERPTSFPSIAGYKRTPNSWAAKSTADGSRRANLSTPAS